MIKKYLLHIFDLDDTLLTTKKAYYAAYFSCADKYLNLSEEKALLALKTLLPIFGSSNSKAILEALFVLFNHSPTSQTIAAADDYFKARFSSGLKFFEGVASYLDKLSQNGCKLALCTNGLGWIQRTKLKHCGLDAKILAQNIFISSEQLPEFKPKPAPDMLLQLIKSNGCSKDQTCFYGNSLGDYLSAVTAGVDFIYFNLEQEKILEQTENLTIAFKTNNWNSLLKT